MTTQRVLKLNGNIAPTDGQDPELVTHIVTTESWLNAHEMTAKSIEPMHRLHRFLAGKWRGVIASPLAYTGTASKLLFQFLLSQGDALRFDAPGNKGDSVFVYADEEAQCLVAVYAPASAVQAAHANTDELIRKLQEAEARARAAENELAIERRRVKSAMANIHHECRQTILKRDSEWLTRQQTLLEGWQAAQAQAEKSQATLSATLTRESKRVKFIN
eukprot:gene15418-12622_t